MGKYDDIIHLPHHVSATRRHMSMVERGAQFSPFAALTGYDAAISETARLTEKFVQLDEDAKEVVNGQLQLLVERLPERPLAEITYFLPDERKAGGAYVTVKETVKRIDPIEHSIQTTQGTLIPVENIFSVSVL